MPHSTAWLFAAVAVLAALLPPHGCEGADAFYGARLIQVCAAEYTPLVYCTDRDPSEYSGYEIELFHRVRQQLGWELAQVVGALLLGVCAGRNLVNALPALLLCVTRASVLMLSSPCQPALGLLPPAPLPPPCWANPASPLLPQLNFSCITYDEVKVGASKSATAPVQQHASKLTSGRLHGTAHSHQVRTNHPAARRSRSPHAERRRT